MAPSRPACTPWPEESKTTGCTSTQPASEASSTRTGSQSVSTAYPRARERGQARVQLLGADRQVEVAVLPGLAADEGIDAPAAQHPVGDAAGLEGIEDPEHLADVHPRTLVSDRGGRLTR